VAAGILPLLLVDPKPPPRPGVSPTPSPRGMDLVGLYRTSPVGFVTVVMIGAANGPFWTLTPVYATDIGLTAVAAGSLMTAVTIGAALFQLPVGKLSDGVDRRRVLLGLALSAGAIELVLGLFGRSLIGWPLLGLGVLLGGLIATQYYTASAHANDRAGPERAINVASALLFLYSVGAITGPLTGSLAMQAFGPGALHLHNLALHLALAAFVLYRITQRGPGAASAY
jgi:MFS family permease